MEKFIANTEKDMEKAIALAKEILNIVLKYEGYESLADFECNAEHYISQAIRTMEDVGFRIREKTKKRCNKVKCFTDCESLDGCLWADAGFYKRKEWYCGNYFYCLRVVKINTKQSSALRAAK